MMIEIELKSPFGDIVILKRTGQFEIMALAELRDSDRFARLYNVGNWLNLEWWPMVFESDYHQLSIEDILV